MAWFFFFLIIFPFLMTYLPLKTTNVSSFGFRFTSNQDKCFHPFMLNVPWLCTSCNMSSPGYGMTSPKHVGVIGDVNMATQESNVVRWHLIFCFWGYLSPHTHLYASLYPMEGQNQLWDETEAQDHRALQTSQHSVEGVPAQSPPCAECLVASFCHLDVGNCISGPEVCFQHYWSCNLVLWPGTCLSTAFLSLTMSKVAKESYCHELGEKSCFMATPVH